MGTGERFVVVGAGAIGGATAAVLARSGCDVTLVCRSAEVARRISQAGISIRGSLGGFRQRIPCVGGIEELSGSFTFALVATKAGEMADAARRLLPFLGPDSLAVSMQNGMCTEALAEVVGPERTVGCVVGWGSTMAVPGDIDVTSTGEFAIGMLPGRWSARMDGLRAALDRVFPCAVSPDILAEKYSKLLINCCIASVGALCGLLLGPMLARADARRIFVAVLREGMAVAEEAGIRVPPYAGRLDYYRLMAGRGRLADLRRTVVIRAFGLKYHRLRSSSLVSLERGRRTEIEFLNGYLERRGRELGVPTPVNSRIATLVREIEQKQRPISPANLAEADPRGS
jgi:2-dehydropantoate 2-reductase